MKMLRIGFDAKRLFNNFTGLGNYGRTVVRGLREQFPENEYVLFTPRLRKNDQTAFFLTDAFRRSMPGLLPGAVWRSFFMGREIRRMRLDIFHGLSNELPAGIRNTGARGIVTVHDLIFRLHKEDYAWIDRNVYGAKVRHACEKADRIIADSRSTKSDLVTHYGISEEKIAVVYPACDERFGREMAESEIRRVVSRYSLPSKYLLYVGTVNRRKNLLALVQALEMLTGAQALPLVVVGSGKGSYYRRVRRYIETSGLQDRIVFAPAVAPEDLPAVYRGSRIFIYPSRYEGFGLPIVEALLSRIPVITSRVSSLPEAAGAGAWYADPDRPGSIAEGILEILNSPDYCNQLAEEGYRHALQFNAVDCSKKLMAVYEEAGRGS